MSALYLPGLVACHSRSRWALARDGQDISERIAMKPRHCREICGEGIALAGFELLNQRIDRLLDQLLNRVTPLSAAVRALGVQRIYLRRIFPVRRGSDLRRGVALGVGWKRGCWHGGPLLVNWRP